MGLPRVSLSITPLHKKLLPNVMDIPFLSSFISNAINTAAAQYVAPKSLMLDLQSLLGTDGIKRGAYYVAHLATWLICFIWIDTEHIGVIIVHIHNAKELKSTDRRTGKSEEFVLFRPVAAGSPLNSRPLCMRLLQSNEW